MLYLSGGDSASGDLFVVDFTGSLRRVSYPGTNRVPTAVALAQPQFGPVPLTVNFDGTGSSDPDAGDSLTYAWDLDGDGQFDDSTAAKPSWTYTSAATVTVRLRVTDKGGLTGTASVTIGATIRGELLQAPTTATGLDLVQSLTLLVLLVAPILLGRLFGYINARSRAKTSGGSRSLPGWVWFIVSWPIRSVFQLFFRPSPLEAQIRKLTSIEPPIYVRIIRQGQEDAIGLLDADSLLASRSARGRGLALAAHWSAGPGGWERLPGCQVSVAEVIEIFHWPPGAGGAAPEWLHHAPSEVAVGPLPRTGATQPGL